MESSQSISCANNSTIRKLHKRCLLKLVRLFNSQALLKIRTFLALLALCNLAQIPLKLNDFNYGINLKAFGLYLSILELNFDNFNLSRLRHYGEHILIFSFFIWLVKFLDLNYFLFVLWRHLKFYQGLRVVFFWFFTHEVLLCKVVNEDRTSWCSNQQKFVLCEVRVFEKKDLEWKVPLELVGV